MRVRLLRGQVVIRERRDAAYQQYTHIVVPELGTDEQRREARRFHVGEVLAMGAPMFARDGATEVAPGFRVGDLVLFHWQHRELSWTREWVDGNIACWIPQAFVDAVLEPDAPEYAATGDGTW